MGNPVGRAAVDVHGMFVNSLIPSSGVKAEQPSVRPDPWPLAYFYQHTVAVKSRGFSRALVECK